MGVGKYARSASGTPILVLVPTPNLPLSPCPQQNSSPARVRAKEWFSPTATLNGTRGPDQGSTVVAVVAVM